MSNYPYSLERREVSALVHISRGIFEFGMRSILLEMLSDIGDITKADKFLRAMQKLAHSEDKYDCDEYEALLEKYEAEPHEAHEDHNAQSFMATYDAKLWDWLLDANHIIELHKQGE